MPATVNPGMSLTQVLAAISPPAGIPVTYNQFNSPNPDLMPNRAVMYAATGGQPDLYVIRRISDDGKQTLPAPSGPTGAGAKSGGANGWTVYVAGGDGIPAGTVKQTKVSYHASGAPSDNTAGPWDYFGFTPSLPGLSGNHTYGFWFAPTATGGGRRGRKSRKSRKGSRRH